MSLRRLLLLIGLLVAVSAASAVAAVPRWVVAVRAHKGHYQNGNPGFQVQMPVGRAAGQRQPQALAIRLLVWKLYSQKWGKGFVRYEVSCGGWKHHGHTAETLQTPVTFRIPFRTASSGFCSVWAFAISTHGSDDVKLDLLCRAKSRRWCTPIRD